MFIGRANEIVNIPSKPTPEGFKIWVLANQGYVLDWLYHGKGTLGPIDLDPHWTKFLGFLKTQAVVLDLVNQEGINRLFKYIIWMDNLFTSARLLVQLEERGFGGAGTVRTTKTQREKDEEISGIKAQKQEAKKEHNRGLDLYLSDIRQECNKQIPWGKLYSSLSEDGQVLEFAWKDQNVVLFMTTVHSGKEVVERLRRRPAIIATSTRTLRLPFGDEPVKSLPIPQFIDMYNHFMGGVDQADQLRSYYSTQRRHNKS